MKKQIYFVRAVVKDRICEDKFVAISNKQAWYYFGCKYSFAMRDFTILRKENLKKEEEQLSFSF